MGDHSKRMRIQETTRQLDAYRTYLRALGHSDSSIRTRCTGIRAAAALARKTPLDLDLGDVLAFVGRPGLSRASRATYWASARAWYAYLIRTGQADADPLAALPAPRHPKGRPSPVTDEQLRLALASATGRLRTWILLAAFAGLRRGEIARFRGEQIARGQITVTGKGDRTDTVPLHPLIAEDAAAYPARGWWFPSPIATSRLPHVTPHTVQVTVGEHLRTVGVDKGGPHRLRHWFGTTIQRTQRDLRVTQTLLRHASSTTTEVYTEVAEEARVAAVVALPMLAGGHRGSGVVPIAPRPAARPGGRLVS